MTNVLIFKIIINSRVNNCVNKMSELLAKEDKISIYEAAYKGDYERVKQLLDDDPSLLLITDDNGRIVLHWAALSGNIRLVTYLIELDSPTDLADDTGTTPLILASSAGRAEVVKLLIAEGVNVNHKTDEGHSALQYACSKGWLEVCTLLLDNRANINIADKRGATPLHRAASKGNLEIVKLLLTHKDNLLINAIDAYDNTALHLACEEDRRDESVLLVQNGAKLGLRNKDRKTPLDLCTTYLHRLLSMQFPHLLEKI